MEVTTRVAQYPKPASEELKQAVREIMVEKGRLYAKIPHPDFDDWPSGHDTRDRQKIIEPHLLYRGGTALEIGCYLAAFSHWLSDLGYKVTAVERNASYVSIGRQVRDLCGKNFDIVEGTFYDLPTVKFDVVLALNVFHHSLKRQRPFQQLDTFLDKVECNMMIFEPHDPAESHMANAYRPMTPEQFCKYVSQKTKLPIVEEIGKAGHRRIFKLTR